MIKKLRGTKDCLGTEALRWQVVERIAQDVFLRFGYDSIRTPILEETDLFKRSVGEVTDIVQKEMYHFTDRSEIDIALRPEGTASVVRSFLENHLNKERSINKLFYYGPMFRAERPQAGRLRQFHQIGAEVFGSNSVYSDLEVIEVLYTFLNELGVKDFIFEINSLGSFEDRNNFSKELKSYFEKDTSKLCEDCQSRLNRNVLRILDCKNKTCQSIMKDAPTITSFISEKAKENFATMCSLLESIQIPYQVNHRIIRGLDYYTDIVFELKHKALGAQDALAAGGRYNGLVKKLGGEEVPGVGFALGIERLFIVLDASGLLKEEDLKIKNQVYFIALGEEPRKKGYLIASDLKKIGIPVYFDFDERSLKAHLKRANKLGAKYVIIFGEEEMKKEQVILKDMLKGGEDAQRNVPQIEVVNTIKGEMEAVC